MGLFRPYERKDTGATAPEDTGNPAAPKTTRISSLTPKGQKRATRPAPVSASAASATSATDISEDRPQATRRTPQKKQGATPTRRQAELNRMQRLHPSLSKKDQRRADRESRYKARIETWDRVEGSAERTLLRDFVDVRWTITEFLLPAMLVLMAAVVATSPWPSISFYLGAGLWVLLGLAVINTAIMWRAFKRVLAERLPNAPKRGLLMYMFNRALMIRRFRRPPPRVARGASI